MEIIIGYGLFALGGALGGRQIVTALRRFAHHL